MALSQTIGVIAKLAEQGVIQNYAITGAVAALNYIQPTLTEDLDVLISLGGFERRGSGLLLLTPIETALSQMGYTERSDLGFMIEGWPVQFLPVASHLDEEGLEQAVHIELTDGSGTKVRCLRAEHVVATAVNLGRVKDLVRIEVFLEQGAVELPVLKGVLERHGLQDKWRTFCLKAGIQDPLALD